VNAFPLRLHRFTETERWKGFESARTRPHAPLFCAPFRRGMSPCCRRSLQQEIPERPRPWSVSQIYNLNSIVSCVFCPEPVLGKRSFRSRKLKVNVESTAVYFVLEPGPCVRCPETAGAKRLSFLYLFIIYYYLLYILLFISFLRNLSFETKKGSLVTIRGLPRQARDTKFEPKRPFRFGLCRFVSCDVSFVSCSCRARVVSVSSRLAQARIARAAITAARTRGRPPSHLRMKASRAPQVRLVYDAFPIHRSK
jgi:hypothetical protein